LKISLICESEGASTKKVFGYDVSYQWNNQKLPQLLCEYRKAFKAGYKSDRHHLNFMGARNREQNDEYWEAWALKSKHCNEQLQHEILCQKPQYPEPPMFYS